MADKFDRTKRLLGSFSIYTYSIVGTSFIFSFKLTHTQINIKLFFSDKGMFFPTLITPVILLVLYMAFLADVFRDSIVTNIGEGVVSDSIIDGIVGGQIISSLLAVSCVTVSFCANLIMIQDKANGSIKDLTIAPIKPHVLPLSYYIASIGNFSYSP